MSDLHEKEIAAALGGRRTRGSGCTAQDATDVVSLPDDEFAWAADCKSTLAATISASTLPPGSNVVEAVYAGDSNFLPSTNSLVQVVNVEAQQPTTLGIRDNGDGSVTAVFSGTVGSQYLVQASSNLATSSWTNVSTNSAGADGTWSYTESKAGYLQRYFRSAKSNTP